MRDRVCNKLFNLRASRSINQRDFSLKGPRSVRGFEGVLV